MATASRQEELNNIYKCMDAFVSSYDLKLSPIKDTFLYLGNFNSVLCSTNVNEANVKIIINVCEEDHSEATKQGWEKQEIQYYWLPIAEDIETQDIIEVCIRVKSIIDKEQPTDTRTILLHCQAAISRSVSTVIFYLMSYGKSYEDSLQQIRQTRPIAQPNEGFAKQLKRHFISNLS